MCGIFFSLSCNSPILPDERTIEILRRRGPDSIKDHKVDVKQKSTSARQPPFADEMLLCLTFTSTVLALRGKSLTVQPLVDETTGSVLCWNGEAWKFGKMTLAGNDSKFLFHSLLHAASSQSEDVTAINGIRFTGFNKGMLIRIAAVMGKVWGPFTFVFYDGISKQVFFGRDHLGRRSLLQRIDRSGGLILASVCDGCHESEWTEVEADGVYVVSLDDKTTGSSHSGSGCAENKLASPLFSTPIKIPYRAEHVDTISVPGIESLLPCLNKSLPSTDNTFLSFHDPVIGLLQRYLSESLTLRVTGVPTPPNQVTPASTNKQTKLAILFSGGLDCTVLARLVHDILPASEEIDLLNVAFENPRVVSASRDAKRLLTKNETASVTNLEAQVETQLNFADKSTPYAMCPDRITGRRSFEELKQICPGRTWRFAEVNIPYSETQQHRSLVISLIHPHNTEMDLSIAYAFYFAARGSGVVYDPSASVYSPYKSPARVLLSGFGADELFAGYTRHGTAYSRRGFLGLLDELELDISRLGKRNLGRDDRVMSHWGKEVRFPYLDEDLLTWALQCPVWQKCGFGKEGGDIPNADEPNLEPEKKILRLLAYKLGMKGVASEKKRAVSGERWPSLINLAKNLQIQFGARTAKMESGKSKGTHILSMD